MSQRIEPSPGVLYLVGTPIGNLRDLSPRAKAVLEKVPVIACEDTRHSGKMLKALGAEGHLISFHQHNIHQRTSHLLKLLMDGKSIALISDAGLPGISDPGEDLVKAVRLEGHEVICIPGPCAATTALVSSGLPCNRYCFEGFLSTKNKQRNKQLLKISKEERTTVIFEAPHRLTKLLEELLELCGEDRPIHIAKELTKLHEQHIGPTSIGTALKYFEANQPKGEFTIVLGGAPERNINEYHDDYLLDKLKALITNGSSASEAAKSLSKATGKSRRELYSLLHQPEKNISI